MHKTESRFTKKTSQRASAVGVGRRSFSADELRTLGLSARAIERFYERPSTGQNLEDALRFTVLEFDPGLHHAIETCRPVGSALSFLRAFYQYRWRSKPIV